MSLIAIILQAASSLALFTVLNVFIKQMLKPNTIAAKQQNTPIVYLNSITFVKYTAKLKGASLLLSTTYHFYITDKLDPYTKASIGLTLWKGDYKKQDGTDRDNEPRKI